MWYSEEFMVGSMTATYPGPVPANTNHHPSPLFLTVGKSKRKFTPSFVFAKHEAVPDN